MQQKPGNRGDPSNCFPVRPSSSGCRQTSRTWRRNPGSSSRKRMPRCARDTSPGRGSWPAPITPTSEMVWWGIRKGRAVTTRVHPRVRPTTRGMWVVSRAAASRSAGRRVAKCRASLELPAPKVRGAGGYRQNARMTFRLASAPERISLHCLPATRSLWTQAGLLNSLAMILRRRDSGSSAPVDPR
jgi:hypothetical protein